MRTEGLWERWSIMGLVCRRAWLRMGMWLAGAGDWLPTTLAPRHWSCWAVTSIRAMSLSRRHLVRSLEPYSSVCFSAAARLRATGETNWSTKPWPWRPTKAWTLSWRLAIGDADAAGFARELARRMAALDAGEDGFVPYGCIVSEGKVPAVVGTGEVPVFAIIAPELLEGIGSPLRELLGSVCAVA